jgi:hypothetical protein
MQTQPPPSTSLRPARPPLRTATRRRRNGFDPPRRAGFSLPTVHEIRRPPVRDVATW